jgi:hypothetical protein
MTASDVHDVTTTHGVATTVGAMGQAAVAGGGQSNNRIGSCGSSHHITLLRVPTTTEQEKTQKGFRIGFVRERTWVGRTLSGISDAVACARVVECTRSRDRPRT